MNQQLAAIAARIKDLREFSDISIEEFADKINMDKIEYAELESGEKDIPIGTLYNIAAALQIDPTVLLSGESSLEDEVAIVYDGAGMKVDRYDGYKFTSLAYNYYGRAMEPMIVELSPDISPELVHHSGQEFNYVLEGNLRVIIGKKEYYLRKGDSIYFNPTLPHAQVAMNGNAKFLTVILEK